MAILLPNGKQAFTSVLGLPLVGGRVYTYAAGTNAPQPTYSDAAGAVPNANPVVLDARGEATIFWNGNYKVVLRDALDNLIWSQDNVSTIDPLAAVIGALQTNLAAAGGGALVGFKQTGIGSVLQTMLGRLLQLPVTPQDFGAKADGVTDDYGFLQLAVNEMRTSGRPLYLTGTYASSLALSITSDDAKRGWTMQAASAPNYYGENRQATIKYTGNAGFALDIQGGATGDGSPMIGRVDGIRFIGNANCAGAIGITRAWVIDIDQCAFANFSKAAGGAITLYANGASGFAGIVNIHRCAFANSGRNIFLTSAGPTGGQINVVRITECTGVGQGYSVFAEFGAFIPFTSNILIENNHWEGTTNVDIYSSSVANNWTIKGNYFEDARPTPSIQFQGAGNNGITIEDNFFRKSGLLTGQTIAYVQNAVGVTFKKNVSGLGGAADRYSAFFLGVTQLEAQPATATGTTPYPLYINGDVLSGYGTRTERWGGSVPGLTGLSSGDGFPGGTVAGVASSGGMANGRYFVDAKVTITKKSGGGTSCLIGVLPAPNAGPDVRFDVWTQNVVGTGPFYAILPNGSSVATIYDANNNPLNYQTAISVGSVIGYSFNYANRGF